LTGDLDVIVMKALEKDRNRRYDTASGFADDVRRYLEDQPILARSPSLAYRVTKFSRRYRWAITTAALFVGVLLAGIGATTWMAIKAQRLLDEYRRDLMDKAMFFALAGDIEKTKTVITQLESLDYRNPQSNTIEGIAAFFSGDMDVAKRLLTEAYEAESDNVAAGAMLCVLQLYYNDLQNADLLLTRVAEMTPRKEARELDSMMQAYALLWKEPAESERLFRKLMKERVSPILITFHAVSVAELGSMCDGSEEANRVVESLNEALSEVRSARTASPPSYFIDLADLFVHLIAMTVRKNSGLDTWNELRESADALAERVATNRSSAVGLMVAAMYYEFLNDTGRAEQMYRQGGGIVKLACLLDSRREPEGRALLDKSTSNQPDEYITKLLLEAFDKGRLPEGVSWEQLFERYKRTRYGIDILQVALALKDLDKCRKAAGELRLAGLPEFFKVAIELRFTDTRIEHLSLSDPPDDWLISSSSNAREKAQALFQTGMLCWAMNDPGKAREYLEAVCRYGNYWTNEIFWARALLTHLKE
jgi:hypothetical protein